MSRSLKVFFELEHKEKIRENIWWAKMTQPVLNRVKENKYDIQFFICCVLVDFKVTLFICKLFDMSNGQEGSKSILEL